MILFQYIFQHIIYLFIDGQIDRSVRCRIPTVYEKKRGGAYGCLRNTAFERTCIKGVLQREGVYIWNQVFIIFMISCLKRF